MKWSTDRPETDGFYWFNGSFRGEADSEPVVFDAPTIIEITNTGMGLYARILGRQWWVTLSLAEGEWAGPLASPN